MARRVPTPKECAIAFLLGNEPSAENIAALIRRERERVCRIVGMARDEVEGNRGDGCASLVEALMRKWLKPGYHKASQS